MATDKDTIYIDVDDEITGIIDKLKASEGKVVALVLPKRAGVFQSIVNMKLLKRAADSSKKNAVLITTEAGLMPLAGAAGLHVAKTLTSKPVIPSGPIIFDESEETVNESEAEVYSANDPVINPDQTVGELASEVAPLAADKGVETIALDNADLAPEEIDNSAAKVAATPKPKKDKKLKIPNFERFRLLLILFVLILIVLIGGFIFANSSLAKATINIKTDATNINANQSLTLTTDTAKNASGTTLPAKLEQQQKTLTQQVATTGQKNNGNKASGTVKMSAQVCGTIPNQQPADVPAGTGLSANGQTYITQQDTSFSADGNTKNHCLIYSATSDTPVDAQSAGASSNTPDHSTFSVAGRSDVSANGSASGGTDNIVQSVNQNDINSAKAKISTSDSSAKQALESQTKGDGYYPIEATFTPGTPVITNSANVGDQATMVTVTETITYTIFGVHQSDLKSALASNINSQIDTAKQSILDDGLSNATYNVLSQTANGATLTISSKAIVGPQLNVDAIKSAAAGQKSGTIEGQLNNNPDVTGVSVSYSPFWVSSAPKDTKKITVNIAKPTSTKSAGNNASKP